MIDVSLFENGISGDIYMGRGSGKKIQESIENAKRRIWVMSPYISPETVNILFDKYDRDVNIKIFTNEREVEKVRKGQSKASNFIVESSSADHKKLTKYIIFLVSTVLLGFFGTFLVVQNLLKSPILIVDTSNLIGFGMLVAAYFLFKTSLRTKFMNYSYASKLPIYFLKDPYASYTADQREKIPYVHSKVYLIDDEVFFGSVNFTNEGFTTNIETRFRTESKVVIEKVVEMFLKIQNDEDSMVDIPTLGFRVFHSKKDLKKKKF